MENNNDNFEKIKIESSKISREAKDKTLGFIITAFGLVAGLAWNEAIQSLIKSFFTIDKNSILAKFIYAIVMTLVLVFITIYLAKIFGKDKEENKK
ncbi:MAG: DUF5654 family protein [Candidatus Falkowbacteria bacterium]